MKRKIKLLIQYNGTAYHGWARQPETETVQGCIEEAFERLTGKPIEVVGSSRTDAGVHALGQVGHAVLEDCPVPTENLLKALNNFLPEDIAIQEVEEVPDSFDAISDTVSKIYKYRILNCPVRQAMEADRCWHYTGDLDAEKMNLAAGRLVGKKDFKSFASAADQRASSVRTILRSEVSRDGDWITYEVEADGFLYNMVRNIVGTLVEVGRGRWEPEIIDEILNAKDRTKAGPIAPAGGLYLIQIKY